MRFVIAGNIGKRKAAMVPHAGGYRPTARRAFRHAGRNRTWPPKKPVCILNDSVDTVYFYIDTFMNRRLEESEVDALGLVNAILTETLYSKILGTARERGLVYGMNSGYQQIKLSSNLWFGSQVSVTNAQALFDIVTEQLNNLFPRGAGRGGHSRCTSVLTGTLST